MSYRGSCILDYLFMVTLFTETGYDEGRAQKADN